MKTEKQTYRTTRNPYDITKAVVAHTGSPLPDSWDYAIHGAFVSRGRKRGYLKRHKPSGAKGVAWGALQSNPYKIPVGAMLLASEDERAMVDAIDATGLVGVDQDREQLSKWGVW